MNHHAESMAYRIYRAMPCPMTQERIIQVVRILGYSSDAPSLSDMPDDVAKTLAQDSTSIEDPLVLKANYAIEVGIRKGRLRRDDKNPDLIIPLSA